MNTFTPSELRRAPIIIGAALHGWLAFITLFLATWGSREAHQFGSVWWIISITWIWWPFYILRKQRQKAELIALCVGSLPMLVVLPFTVALILQLAGFDSNTHLKFR